MDGSSALFQGSFGKEELRQSVRHSEKMDESGDRCQQRECGEKHRMIGDRSTLSRRRRVEAAADRRLGDGVEGELIRNLESVLYIQILIYLNLIQFSLISDNLAQCL